MTDFRTKGKGKERKVYPVNKRQALDSFMFSIRILSYWMGWFRYGGSG